MHLPLRAFLMRAHNTTMTTYTGGCHCKKVRYEVTLDLTQSAIECNCSHCQIKGFILQFTSPDNFTLTQGEDALKTYTFNKHLINHRFCDTCGVQAFANGVNPDGSPAIAVNLRSIDDIDLCTINRIPYDGKNA